MPTLTAQAAAEPDPDAGYQALLDHVAVDVDRLPRLLGAARAAAPGRRPAALDALADALDTAAGHLRRHLGGWPPPPATDEAP